ncbi:hypothetical protein ACFXTH_046780 [Malus domestica]
MSQKINSMQGLALSVIFFLDSLLPPIRLHSHCSICLENHGQSVRGRNGNRNGLLWLLAAEEHSCHGADG